MGKAKRRASARNRKRGNLSKADQPALFDGPSGTALAAAQARVDCEKGLTPTAKRKRRVARKAIVEAIDHGLSLAADDPAQGLAALADRLVALSASYEAHPLFLDLGLAVCAGEATRLRSGILDGSASAGEALAFADHLGWFRRYASGDATAIFRLGEQKRAGGRNSRKWTPEVDRRALELYAEIKTPRLKREAAYRRVAARLSNEMGTPFGWERLGARICRALASKKSPDNA